MDVPAHIEQHPTVIVSPSQDTSGQVTSLGSQVHSLFCNQNSKIHYKYILNEFSIVPYKYILNNYY